VIVVELRWRLGFHFEVKLVWRGVGEVCPTGDSGGARVAARVSFCGEIGVEGHMGGAPELI
jgi:hypothetical protein